MSEYAPESLEFTNIDNNLSLAATYQASEQVIQTDRREHKVARIVMPIALALGGLGIANLASASTGHKELKVTPVTHLRNGSRVVVSGSGFAPDATGSILECNDAPQPKTVEYGNKVPVSCSNPLPYVVTTTSSGELKPKAFTVRSGKTGSTAEAAKYPCPPTAAQIKRHYSCVITFGDDKGDDVSRHIAFAPR